MVNPVPNPAKDNTIIFYSFVNKNSAKKLVMVDMLGRILQEWLPEESQGEINVDCRGYANGQYLILDPRISGLYFMVSDQYSVVSVQWLVFRNFIN